MVKESLLIIHICLIATTPNILEFSVIRAITLININNNRKRWIKTITRIIRKRLVDGACPFSICDQREIRGRIVLGWSSAYCILPVLFFLLLEQRGVISLLTRIDQNGQGTIVLRDNARNARRA